VTTVQQNSTVVDCDVCSEPIGTKPKLPSASTTLFKPNIITFRNGMKARPVPSGHCLRKLSVGEIAAKKCDVR
jgi:hypothetical protein